MDKKELELLTKARKVKTKEVEARNAIASRLQARGITAREISAEGHFEIPTYRSENKGHVMLKLLINSMMKNDAENDVPANDPKDARIKSRYMPLIKGATFTKQINGHLGINMFVNLSSSSRALSS